MSGQPGMDDARRLWHAAEPLHATVYFAPETAQAATDCGLKGFWMGYFAGRAAAMGAVGAPVVAATFFNFHPAMVARAIPDAWRLADPVQVVRRRRAAVASALRRLLPADADVVGPAQLATAACAGLDCAGRPLAAAWAGQQPSGDAVEDLWLACTVLREHRGDGHVAALVDAGLTGCEAHVLAAATGGAPREVLQPNRGWSDVDWSGAVDALRRRGWLDGDGGATDAGRQARRRIERRTDELATAPLRALGPDGARRLVELLERLAGAVLNGGGVPFPNPMGLPAPGRTGAQGR